MLVTYPHPLQTRRILLTATAFCAVMSCFFKNKGKLKYYFVVEFCNIL